MNLQKLFAVLSVGLIIWGLAFSVVRAETRQGEKVTVSSDEVINDDLYIAATEVGISGVVNGNVYIAGQSVTISGEINGDLFVAAETITVTGNVNDDIRALGKTLVISDVTVTGGIMFMGEELLVEDDTEVVGNIMFLGGLLKSSGSIQGDVTGAAEVIDISGDVEGSVNVNANTISIRDSAVIGGDLEYKSIGEASIADSATIDGEISRKIREVSGGFAPNIPLEIWSYLSAFIVGLTLLLIFPRPTVALADRIAVEPVKTFLTGLVVLVVTIPVAFIILLTLVGVPLSLILFTSFFVSVFVAKIFVALAIGDSILKKVGPSGKSASPYLNLAFGLLLVQLSFLFPFVGTVLTLVVVAFGLGAITYGFQRIRRI